MNANHVKRNLPYIIMAIPAVSIFSVFFIIPLIFTTKYSFYNWTNFSPDIVFAGLKNYKQLFADGIILKGLKNTMVFAILTVTIQSMISLPVSVLLNSKLRGRTVPQWYSAWQEDLLYTLPEEPASHLSPEYSRRSSSEPEKASMT